jgi:hypothetical protein
VKIKALTRRQLLPIICAVALIPLGFAGVKILTDPIKPWMSQENWVDLASRNASLTVRGIIKEVELNHISYGYVGYHIFPALIILNVTEVVWMNDEVSWFLATEINNTFYNSFWKAGNPRMIGYDLKEPLSLTQGDYVVASGYWVYTTDSAYSMTLVIAPNVNESYIKPVA